MTIIVDTREQQPYDFSGHKVINQALAVGDYSLSGFEKDGCIVERKSLSDFIGSITTGREQFMSRLCRMAEYERSWLILEASASRIDRGQFSYSKVNPNSIFGTIYKIESEIGVSVILADTYRLGQAACLGLLYQYYQKKRSNKI